MKVVINRCYGGFGLSHEAVMLYAKLKDIQLFAYVYDYETNAYIPYQGQQNCLMVEYFTQPISLMTNEEKAQGYPNHRFWPTDLERHDPVLVQVVETLGDKANGTCAKLRIEEIIERPPYSISEYDGLEQLES